LKPQLLFAGDDMSSSLTIRAIFNSIQVVFAMTLLILTNVETKSDEILKARNDCSGGAAQREKWTHIYASISLFVCSLSLCLVGAMIYFGGLGTPTDPSPREPLRQLCYFDVIVINSLRVTVFCLASVLLGENDKYCECLSGNIPVDTFKEAFVLCGSTEKEFMAIYGCLAITHCIDIIKAVFAIISNTCCHDKLIANANMSILPSKKNCSVIMKGFMGCTGLITCGIFGGDEAIRSDYASFSLLMANYLNGDGVLDLTASDIFVGLYMVAMVKRLKKIETRNRIVSDHSRLSNSTSKNSSGQSRSVSTSSSLISKCGKIGEERSVSTVSPNGRSIEVVNKEYSASFIGPVAREQKMEMLSCHNSVEVDLINEAAHFMVFAEAAYTVIGYMLRHPFTGPISLFSRLIRKCACISPSRNESIEQDNICHLHTIALKATSGLEDEEIIYANYSDNISKIPYMILLDHDWKSIVVTIRGTMSLESAVTDIEIAPEELTKLGEEYGFNGHGLYCHTGMLATTDWLYRDIKKHGRLEKTIAEYEGYKLRIIGHSLGAGVASILSFLLRPKYPQLRCIAFSPPGCVMSENLANETKDFTTTYVVNDDIIIRINYENFEELRNGVLEMICRIKIPKDQVTKMIKKYDDSSVEGLSKTIDEILYKKEEIKDSQFKRQVDDFLSFQSKLKEQHKEHYIKLCPPGSIIQLFRTKHIVNDFGEEIGLHVARWAERSDFEHIELSPHFIFDHRTDSVTDKIQKLAKESFGLSPPFSPRPDVAEP